MAGEERVLPRTNAWLLDFGQGLRAAVGTRVLVHLIDNPAVFTLPYTPSYCRQVVFWQGRLLPVMDMAARLGAASQRLRLLAVACYQDQAGKAPRFGALQLSAAPTPIAVTDHAGCPLPEQPTAWNRLALSCFDYRGVPVPILHLGRIFSGAPAAIHDNTHSDNFD
jgi:hypothetical protein